MLSEGAVIDVALEGDLALPEGTALPLGAEVKYPSVPSCTAWRDKSVDLFSFSVPILLCDLVDSVLPFLEGAFS